MMKTRTARTTWAGMILVCLGGCATRQAASQREREAPALARWEAVVLPEATVEELEGGWGPETGWAWWEGRRDGELAIRGDAPLLASDQWPEPVRPTLDRPRYLTLPSRPETLIYFRTPRW